MELVFWTASLFHFVGFVYSSVEGNSHPNISIIGGTSVASSDQFPFMASLPLALGSCGGTLIDPSYILTAAHCVSLYTQADAVDFPVYLKTLNVLGGETDSIKASVSSFVIHEGYSNVGTGYVNDIALLILSQPVTNISPIPLPIDSTTTMTTTTTNPTTTTTNPTTTTTKTTTKPTTTTTKTTTKPTTTTTKTTTKPTTTTTKTTTKPTTTTTKTTTKPTTTTTKTTTKPTTATTKTTTKPTTTTTKTTTKSTTTTKTTTKPTTTTTKTTTKPTTTKTTTKPTTTKTTTKPPTTTTKTTKQPTTAKTTNKPTTKKVVMRAFSAYANMDAVVTGWGLQANGFNSDVLMTTAVTIFDNDVCVTKWGGNLFDGNSMMCASKDGQSVCMDDDGGPIIVDGVQVGITSFFPETCGDANFPAVFTRTSSYISWIQTAMAANPPPS